MLIIKIQNDGTGTVEVGNYRYQVLINSTVIESGDIKGHRRSSGWRKLVGRLLESSLFKMIGDDDIEDELQAQVDRLTAERDAWRDRNARQEQHYDKLMTERNELEAENNKAKSLIGMKDDSLETYDEFYTRCLVAIGYPEDACQSSAMDDLIVDKLLAIAQLTTELADWKADAERLATILDNLFTGCILCNGKKKGDVFMHDPDCPITLHRQLCEKYEVME